MTTFNHNPQLILIINSEFQTNHLISQIIQSMGYSVEVSESTHNAQKYFPTNVPGLIIINEDIAVQDDFSWVKSIREKLPLLPIILYTAHDNHQILKKALRLGISDYISTPLTKDEIQNSIKANITQSQTMRNFVLLN